MDNLTHTLIGTLVGETLARVTSGKSSRTSSSDKGLAPTQRRNLMVAVAAISSNLPDLDFIYSAVTGSKLDYLLQHRGYTHTVIGALVIAAIVLLACEGWCRWRHWTMARSDRVQLGGVALLTLLLHIAMDFTNSYGVHPFWPLYNGWLYGDSVFIVEPLLWAAAAPLIALLRTLVARVLVALVIVAGIAFGSGSGLIPAMFAVVLALLFAVMVIIGYRAAPRTALFTGVAVWIAVTAMFAGARSIANRQITTFVAQHFDGAHLLDNALTPMPANPVCWDALLVMMQADRYVIRHATWSIAPAVMTAQACPVRMQVIDVTAPLVPVQTADSPSAHWWGEVEMPGNEIAQLAATNCEAAAFMRFARVPWAMQRDDRWLVGDLRYDREPGLGFAELELPEGSARCPRHVPPWIPPRAEIISSSP